MILKNYELSREDLIDLMAKTYEYIALEHEGVRSWNRYGENFAEVMEQGFSNLGIDGFSYEDCKKLDFTKFAEIILDSGKLSYKAVIEDV